MSSATRTSVDTTRSGPRSALALAVFAVAVAVAAGIGGVAAASASETYEALDRPFFAPPSWLFGPVWTVLYVLIAIAAWRCWRRTGVAVAIAAWGVQLVLNACWTPLFFGADRYGLAFAEIVVLLVAIVTTVVLFARRDRVAAALLLPYLAWTAYAAALNLAIWQLN